MKLPYTSKIGLPRRVQRWVVAAFIIVAGAMSIWRTSISRGKNSAGVGTSAVQYVNDAFDGSKTEHTAQAQGEVSVDSIVSERLSSIHQTVLRRREPPDLSLVWEDDMEVAGNATDEDRPESHVVCDGLSCLVKNLFYHDGDFKVFLSLGEMEKLRKKNLIKRRTPSSIAINGSPAGQTFVDLTLSIQVEPLERYPKETGHSRTIEGWTSVVNMPYQVKFARTFLAYAAGIVFTLSMFNVSISQATTVVSSHLRSINLDKKNGLLSGKIMEKGPESESFFDCFHGCWISNAVVGIHQDFLENDFYATQRAYIAAASSWKVQRAHLDKLLCAVIKPFDVFDDGRLKRIKAATSQSSFLALPIQHNIVNMPFKNLTKVISNCEMVLADTIDTGILVLPSLHPNSVLVTFSTNPKFESEGKNLAILLGIRYVNLERAMKTTVAVEEYQDTMDPWSPSKKVKISDDLEARVAARAFQERRFFLYMPWEQLNNQLIALRCACAAARVLNRTLVIPPLGYRHPNRTEFEWDFNFKISDLLWQPAEKYLDEDALRQMPCQTVPLQEFMGWSNMQSNYSLKSIYFNPVAKATDRKQIEDFYGGLLGLRIESIDDTKERLSQLTKQQILAAFGSSTDSVVAMGSAFWLYGFGRIQPYPLTKYFNYMDHPVYRQTVSGIRANTRLMRIIGAGMEWLRYGKSTQNSRKKWWSNRVISIHIRRGDYWNKCRKIEDPILRAKCYPSAHDIVAALYKVSGTFSWMTVLSSRFRPIVYVATNSHDVKKELESAKKRYQFVYFEDVFPSSSFGNEIPLDPINSALIDIELCSLTDAFVGNIFSSFSRSIFEKRELSGKPFTTF